MIDVPCGDVNWIFDSLETDTLPLYVGLDVTNSVIKVNRERLGHHINKQFFFWDATLCPLPKFCNETAASKGGDGGKEQSFELVHVRDVIQHLTLDQGIRYFCNIFTSGAKVLITTTYPSATSNTNIAEGRWYKNNLRLEPFSFPEVNCTRTHPGIEDDHTCIYILTENWVKEFVSSKC